MHSCNDDHDHARMLFFLAVYIVSALRNLPSFPTCFSLGILAGDSFMSESDDEADGADQDESESTSESEAGE